MERKSNGITCFVLVRTEVGMEHEVAERIKRLLSKAIEGDVYVTYGMYDLVVVFRAPSLEKIDYIITNIRNIQGIRETATLISS